MAGSPTRCPRCRVDFLGTPTADGRRKCRNCMVVWKSQNGRNKIIWTPQHKEVG